MAPELQGLSWKLCLCLRETGKGVSATAVVFFADPGHAVADDHVACAVFGAVDDVTLFRAREAPVSGFREA